MTLVMVQMFAFVQQMFAFVSTEIEQFQDFNPDIYLHFRTGTQCVPQVRVLVLSCTSNSDLVLVHVCFVLLLDHYSFSKWNGHILVCSFVIKML
jgi:hypothetical protein